MVFDAYDGDYALMLSHAKSLTRSTQRGLVVLFLDTGVIAPLFYIVLKCRDLEIRRAAIALLKQAPAREGMWLRDCVVQYAEWKVAMEEQGRGGLLDTDTLPESARIYGETAREAVVEGKRVTVLCFRRGRADEGSEGGIEESITDLSLRMAGLVGAG